MYRRPRAFSARAPYVVGKETNRKMRYAKGRREETRRRIVETAARLFREKGVDRVGVDEIMSAAGLTHGGFYVHFRSKQALIAEACALAVDLRADEWKAQLRTLPPEEAFAGFLTQALESGGCDECALSIGAEVARQGEDVRRAYTGQIEELVQYMTTELACGREEAILALVAASGAINMAKASNDPAFSREVIETTHRNLILLWKDRCGDRVQAAPAVQPKRSTRIRARRAAVDA